jgi:hypothetical protein
MKRLLLAAVFGFFCLGAGPACRDAAELEQEARAATRDFMTTLKGHLGAAIKEGGPAHAIGVCSEVAPRIAARISRERGWEVGRTSLRLRNTANLPEAWEEEILERFAGEHEAGAAVAQLEYSDVVEVSGEKRFRYMKAIPTQEICLQCHGENLHGEVREQLSRDYPHDQATGFALEDIRGAFTIEMPLPETKKDSGS